MRYVIKKEGEGYFTEMGIVETKAVTLKGVVMGHEDTHRPKFEAFKPGQAAKFDTEQDAKELMANAEFGGAEAFAGCTVAPEA